MMDKLSSGFRSALRRANVALCVAAGVGWLGACGPAGEEPSKASELKSSKGKVVAFYDTRMDVYAHPNAALVDLAIHSTPTLMHVSAAPSPADVAASQILGLKKDLCPGERFYDDPTLGNCSGVLIDDDLVLTAGHCVGAAGTACSSNDWVFGYYRTSAATVAPMSSDDYFTCSEIVVNRKLEPGSSFIEDYAVVRLNRSATPRFTPARVAFGNYPFLEGQPMAVIGSPSGIPLKIDSDGNMNSIQNSYHIKADLDTFNGNSGSALYALGGNTVAGVLYAGSGGDDYVRNSANTCNLTYSTPWSYTAVGYAIRPILDKLCAVPGLSLSNQRLCFKNKGVLESIDGNGWVTGWVFDRRTPESQVTVSVSITRTTFPVFATSFTVQTDQLRTDINQQFGLTGTHGFRFQIPASYRTTGVVAVSVSDSSVYPPTSYALASSPMFYSY